MILLPCIDKGKVQSLGQSAFDVTIRILVNTANVYRVVLCVHTTPYAFVPRSCTTKRVFIIHLQLPYLFFFRVPIVVYYLGIFWFIEYWSTCEIVFGLPESNSMFNWEERVEFVFDAKKGKRTRSVYRAPVRFVLCKMCVKEIIAFESKNRFSPPSPNLLPYRIEIDR